MLAIKGTRETKAYCGVIRVSPLLLRSKRGKVQKLKMQINKKYLIKGKGKGKELFII